MAWNEPGKDDKDPWKNKGGNNQGPPDLDDLFKDLGNKMGGMFGGSSSSKGSQNNFSGLVFGIALAVAVVAYVISGFYTIKEAEQGVKLRFGEYVELVNPGLNWNWTFIERVQPVDVQNTRDFTAEGFMLTQDENVVEVEMQVQYRVTNPRNYLFSTTNADDSLRQALDSALRYVVGHSIMDDVLTSGRETVRQSVWSELEKIIEPYNLGLTIVDVNFKNSRPPEQVKNAFDDAIAAQEDEERFRKEAEAYARSIEPIARGQVRRYEEDARAYKEQTVLNAEGAVARFEKLLPEYQAAPEVTRQRLYIDTMEKVYSNTSKVMVDVEGGNSMMYLPLDKIMQQQKQQLNIPKAVQDLTQQQGNLSNPPLSSKGRGDRFSNDRFKSGRE